MGSVARLLMRLIRRPPRTPEEAAVTVVGLVAVGVMLVLWAMLRGR